MLRKELNPLLRVAGIIIGLAIAFAVIKVTAKPALEATLAKQLPAVEREFQFTSYRPR